MKPTFDLTKHLPLIAIIRGVTPQDVIEVTQILIDEGFTMIEVPLNSPGAIESISKLVQQFGTKNYLLGAGTVTNMDLAKQVVGTGANLVVTPNCNTDVIRFSADAGCAVFTSIVTPTEAFAALDAGATGLKLFPVSMVGLDGFKALNSVLPKGTRCYPVGGIDASVASMNPYVKIGAAGFGLGSALYKPTMSMAEIRTQAKAFVAQYKLCLNNISHA
ncbi:2-dehydro-3-deoxy-6-phosphogalactonate aldolase [Psychrosphaera algicola]|uniref:2-dehydro-3-deoxy-6-phosphogalactonate aldolase n=1 Tax=Psychrosphaera algicola TaxID=3023714 RepID=A0ABT5FJ53_9GAMM|nr:2-dehydro-3-deoxy-6-phosphogalactonate aldolase [Psychrosphaera sp. G1-22]MDC2891230.1 2-dehydro-3-deoxy-6-phosphogalactonate aldolase [Psychrosphaera sp. G1-22]